MMDIILHIISIPVSLREKGFVGWTGLRPEGYDLLTQAGCIEGLRKKGS